MAAPSFRKGGALPDGRSGLPGASRRQPMPAILSIRLRERRLDAAARRPHWLSYFAGPWVSEARDDVLDLAD